MVDLQARPFNLDDEAVRWVEKTLAGMTPGEKAGQLFCPIGMSDRPEHLLPMLKEVGIGGIMFRPGPGAAVQKTHRFLQENSKIPLLLAANLEAGGSGTATDGTFLGHNLQCAATGEDVFGYHLGAVSCAEGAAVGINWAFAPVVDIDMNFRSPITNLRTFGSSPERVIAMAKGYMKAADEYGVAVSIKHFPGDGVDERDQHLLTTVNSLSAEEYEKTFGRVYRELIEAGAKTVMVGHIAQPAMAYKIEPSLTKRQAYMPATLQPALLQGLLRGQMGFNGLICTDASSMIGFTAAMKRREAVPLSIAAGCDVFLFNKNLPEDYGYMMEGVQSGVITAERLDEAVTRILAVKASIGLHKKQEAGALVPGGEALKILACAAHKALERECADKAVTLVKDTQGLLPLNPAAQKRMYLNVLEADDDINTPLRRLLKEKFEAEGFEVTLRSRDMRLNMREFTDENFSEKRNALMAEMAEPAAAMAERYDVAVYVANFETASNNTVIRLGWRGMFGLGNDSPWFVSELPTLFISLANPYHLLDVPMIKTFINAYSAAPVMVDSVIGKIMGRSEFRGVSPVDPFCGREDARF